MLKLTSEQRPVFNQAAAMYAAASGLPGAAAVEALENDPSKLADVITGLRAMSKVSPLADEIAALIPVPEPVAADAPIPKPAPAPKVEPTK